MKSLVFLFLLAACGADKKSEPQDAPIAWPADTDCDGLLWAGLAAASGESVDLLSARDSNGQWHRRPVSYGECYPNEAQSTISRDQFVGLLAGLVRYRDLATIEQTLHYAITHGGVMGEPFPGDGRVIWTSNMYALYARAAIFLGGTDARWFPLAAVPLTLGPTNDYGTHLQLIELAIYARTGGLASYLVPVAFTLAAMNPGDALAQSIGCIAYMPGTCAQAAALLAAPDYQGPNYVRGPDDVLRIHKAFAASIY